jgi:dTDP-glucose 4,6-dehydratase
LSKSPSMRVLVTGAAGFLGSHLCDALIEQQHFVVGVDNLSTGRLENLAHLDREPRFEFVERDICTPFDPGQVDYIYNLASPASPVHYHRLGIETLQVGSYGVFNTLELARKYNAGFLHASTSECYGDPKVHPQPESYWGNANPVGERSVYDEAKRFAEAAVMAYHRHHRVNTHLARIFNTYGPRLAAGDGRVISNFIVQALAGEPLTVQGNGSQTRSFCYVSDLIDGLLRLAKSDEALPVNLGNPDEWTILELARHVLEVTGSSSEIVFRDLPPDDPTQRRPDITKAKDVLGWDPLVPLSEGLRHTLAYFRGPVQSTSRPPAKTATAPVA